MKSEKSGLWFSRPVVRQQKKGGAKERGRTIGRAFSLFLSLTLFLYLYFPASIFSSVVFENNDANSMSVAPPPRSFCLFRSVFGVGCCAVLSRIMVSPRLSLVSCVRTVQGTDRRRDSVCLCVCFFCSRCAQVWCGVFLFFFVYSCRRCGRGDDGNQDQDKTRAP